MWFRSVVIAGVVGTAACANPASDARDAYVVGVLAEDNYVWQQRDPELVALKLRKMQRGPYEWLRGTAAIYWRDLMAAGNGERPATAFGDAASSRVLLVGDPHVENVGTFRTSDDVMVVDWNDFDAVGYGPFGGDVRRLAAAIEIAGLPRGADGVIDVTAPLDDGFARAVAIAYADEIERLANGTAPVAVEQGAAPYFDELIDKARENGDRHEPLDEIAPVMGGVRELAFGDLEAVADDGVIEDRLVPVGAEAAAWIEAALARWRAEVPAAAAIGASKLRARRIGAGVSSYAALRYNVILEGPTPALDDDVIVELKEQRDGLIVRGTPQLAAAEWSSPARRAVDAQLRQQVLANCDPLLGAADLGGLSLRIRDRSSYQRGADAGDIGELAHGEQQPLASVFGAMLARAHGHALTADGVKGATVIAPLLAGRKDVWTDEIARDATADATQLLADYTRMKDRDLAAEIR